MNAPISYFGGKSKMGAWIMSLFPAHELYVEPFCGSAAVLFAKAACRYEIINDVDGELINFFRILRDRPDELAEVCTWTPYARDELTAAQVPAAEALERARRFWVRSTQSFNGRVSHTRSWGCSVEQNTWRPRAVQNKVQRLRQSARRLLNVAIENDDATEIITRYARPGAIVYVDPPYLFDARRQQSSPSKQNGYQFEYGTEAEHRRLAVVLRDCQATVLLSAYPSPLYEELYGDWYRAERRVVVHAAAWKGGKRELATELFLSNRPLGFQLRLDAGDIGDMSFRGPDRACAPGCDA